MKWKEIILEFCLDITVKGFSKITIKNYKSKLGNIAIFFQSMEIEPLIEKETYQTMDNGYARKRNASFDNQCKCQQVKETI